MIDKAIATAVKETGWTDKEVRNFLSCIRANSPDELLDACAAAVMWAKAIETKEAVVSLMKTLPRGAIQAEWTGDDIAVRLNPEATITTDDNGTLNIDWPEEAAQ